jgi:hypothetical protein
MLLLTFNCNPFSLQLFSCSGDGTRFIGGFFGERGRLDRIRRRPAHGILFPKPAHLLGESASINHQRAQAGRAVPRCFRWNKGCRFSTHRDGPFFNPKGIGKTGDGTLNIPWDSTENSEEPRAPAAPLFIARPLAT